MYHSSFDQSLIPHRLNNHYIFVEKKITVPRNKRAELLKNLIMKIPMTTLTKPVMYFQISNRIVSLDVMYQYLHKHVLPISSFSIFFRLFFTVEIADSLATHTISNAWADMTKKEIMETRKVHGVKQIQKKS